MKENPNPLPKAPNPELILHEQKRKIESQLFTLSKRLKLEGKSEDEVSNAVAAQRQRLTADIGKTEASVSDKDQHMAALARQKHIEKLKDALKIGKNFEGGVAFDFELQERKRMAGIAERDQKRKEEKRMRKEAKRQKEREALQAQLAAMT